MFNKHNGFTPAVFVYFDFVETRFCNFILNENILKTQTKFFIPTILNQWYPLSGPLAALQQFLCGPQVYFVKIKQTVKTTFHKTFSVDNFRKCSKAKCFRVLSETFKRITARLIQQDTELKALFEEKAKADTTCFEC